MEYKGYEILSHDGWVVLGDDPCAEPVRGYVAQVRRRDPEPSPDGDVVWDFPPGFEESEVAAATQAEAIEKAKALIDADGKRPRD